MKITAQSRISELLERYPTAGPLLIQSGPLYVNRRGELYARFPDLSVEEFARQNGIDLSWLLKELEAAARADEAAARETEDAARPDTGEFSLTIGYTGSYRPDEDSVPDKVSVVSAQSARGPE